MGLESVELVLEVEDQFKVSLSDPECSQVRTVADLAALIISRLPRESPGCPTAKRFFLVRDGILAVTGLPPRTVRPRTRLEIAFPRQSRRKQWATLRTLDRITPSLAAPWAVFRALFWLTFFGLIAWLIAAAAIWGSAGPTVALLATIAMLVVGGQTSAFVYSRFAVCFPDGCNTIADLVRLTMPPTIPTERGERLAAEHAILRKVREIIAKQLRMDLDLVQPESRFNEDLRVN